MSIAENKYHSTIKVEFKELASNIANSGRTQFHMYTIHRLLSLGLLIDFPFQYVQMDNPKQVGIELDLKDCGKVLFIVDIESQYGKVSSDICKANLIKFSKTFDTCIDTPEPKKRRRKLWFDK